MSPNMYIEEHLLNHTDDDQSNKEEDNVGGELDIDLEYSNVESEKHPN